MIKKIMTAALFGINAVPVEVEADVSSGLPATIIVGLPDTAVQESRERVRSAIRNSNFTYPQTRVSINLAPADVQKNGTHFDLPIAVAILASAELIKIESDDALFVGELSLDGQLRSCSGVVAMVELAKQSQFKKIFVPAINAQEAALVKGIDVYGVENLQQVVLYYLGQLELLPAQTTVIHKFTLNNPTSIDFSEIAGQHVAKRALEIAAAGGHNIRMIGPPGSGKTMLAKALSGILPPLSEQEQLLQFKIASASGKVSKTWTSSRPFRSPHHTSSAIALIGGGSNPVPGEVTLSHGGVLFLDEFPEFGRNALEVLRQPLEDGYVSIARAKQSLQFPADFILVAAQNPCPCGNYGEVNLHCRCLPTEVQKYNKKLSGPLLDRIDLHIHVPRVSFQEIQQNHQAEATQTVAERVRLARRIQSNRFKLDKTNSQMTASEVKKYCLLSESAETILETVVDKHNLSGRSVHRLLKVARTIADLSSQSKSQSNSTAKSNHVTERIQDSHILEALQYRLL